jgi:hypothetical protein
MSIFLATFAGYDVDSLKIFGSEASLIGDLNAFTCVPGTNLDFKYQWG